MSEGFAPIPDLPDDYDEDGSRQLCLDLGLPKEGDDERLTLADIAIAAGLAGLATSGLYWLGSRIYGHLRTA